MYPEYEVDRLIEELTEAAQEAIAQAAGEAAKAARLTGLEREAAAIREARGLREENSRLKQGRVRTAVVTGLVCFVGGSLITCLLARY